jgi:hypothetical protein
MVKEMDELPLEELEAIALESVRTEQGCDHVEAVNISCKELLDRGWGKPDKTHHHDGDIRQHIISDRPLTLDEWTAKYCRA